MQTKKKIPSGNCALENASPRVTRSRKKVPENVEITDKKVSELITSSARKKKVGKFLSYY